MPQSFAKPLAFISHSSKDKERAVELVKALREYEVDVWIDHEQIGFGDSIVTKISQGLEHCTVILVLISKAFAESSWCRAEYEPLLVREIESGKTSVIPVMLDRIAMPVFFRAKRYIDFHSGIDKRVVSELANQIRFGTNETFANRLPKDRSYHCSLLSMVIGGVVKDFPVESMTDEGILDGRSLLDLYRTVDALVTRFQDIVDVLLSGERHSASYDSRMLKLKDTEREMRTLVNAFDGVLAKNSSLRSRLNGIFQLCVQIGGSDDALVVSLGGQDDPLPWDHHVHDHVGKSWWEYEDHDAYVVEAAKKASEYQKLLTDLSAYRHDLRDAIARLTATA